MTQAFILGGLFVFLVVGWWFGRDFGKFEASLEWIPRMKNAREAHMTDLYNAVRLALLKGPMSAHDYVVKAIDRIPADFKVTQPVPKKGEDDGPAVD